MSRMAPARARVALNRITRLNGQMRLDFGMFGRWGKSTVLAEFAARGVSVVAEPGRRIVKQELERNGNALSWTDKPAFAHRAIEMAQENHVAALSQPGWTFFDRGVVDAVAALQQATGEPIHEDLITANRYHERVFPAPPWPEIYGNDPER